MAEGIDLDQALRDRDRFQSLNAEELLSYANQERRRIGRPLLIYGL